MATYTENYNLLLTEAEDYFDITDYNENFEAIDTLMAENDAVVNEVNKKLGVPDENETFFSLLKTGGSIIKSIQKVTYTIVNDTTSGSVSINTVNPKKCIVIFERLQNNFTYLTRINYTLNEDSLLIEHLSYNTNDIRSNLFGFWIIEFN